jgi:hypothetical protein
MKLFDDLKNMDKLAVAIVLVFVFLSIMITAVVIHGAWQTKQINDLRKVDLTKQYEGRMK